MLDTWASVTLILRKGSSSFPHNSKVLVWTLSKNTVKEMYEFRHIYECPLKWYIFSLAFICYNVGFVTAFVGVFFSISGQQAAYESRMKLKTKTLMEDGGNASRKIHFILNFCGFLFAGGSVWYHFCHKYCHHYHHNHDMNFLSSLNLSPMFYHCYEYPHNTEYFIFSSVPSIAWTTSGCSNESRIIHPTRHESLAEV